MAEPGLPVHEFFGAIYGHFFLDAQGQPSALYEGVHHALQDERYAGLARTLMDYVAGDVEVQWVSENADQAAAPSFTMHTDARGELDLVRLAQERSDIYAEAFQVAVTRMFYRERLAYNAYFALVLDVFEAIAGPSSAPLREAPS